ncbi:hypothetical protein D0C16_21085 [Cellvibrio sp. KY-GH-1]|uniref:hypothetical protein n=1 Tax=Cellvibrio sp. KY-GH-1 TaxID=2303332 RepID=UPI00124509F4|nr:hypothetical protein [Cellvibrio sp. KY-GH-1]QEY18260.1 hypothetical protein D0C16_21085 [Cellvibrio sp. KY-GH-1]
MKKLNLNSQLFSVLTAVPLDTDSEEQLPLNVAIRRDYQPLKYRKPIENLQQSATDEGLKRERQQQHKSWLDKLREQPH